MSPPELFSADKSNIPIREKIKSFSESITIDPNTKKPRKLTTEEKIDSLVIENFHIKKK